MSRLLAAFCTPSRPGTWPCATAPMSPANGRSAAPSTCCG